MLTLVKGGYLGIYRNIQKTRKIAGGIYDRGIWVYPAGIWVSTRAIYPGAGRHAMGGNVMEVTEEAREMMYLWLLKRYGHDQAVGAIVSVVDQLRTVPHYAIVKLGRGAKLEEVNARFSNIKPAGIGMCMFGIRIWVNHREWLGELNMHIDKEVV